MPGYCTIDIFSRICLGLITAVIVIGGIFLVAVLVKVKRLVDEAAKIIRQTRETLKPLSAVAGIVVGLTKFGQFFKGTKGKKEG